MQRLLFTMLLVVSLLGSCLPAGSASAAALQLGSPEARTVAAAPIVVQPDAVNISFTTTPPAVMQSGDVTFTIQVTGASAGYKYRYRRDRNGSAGTTVECPNGAWSAPTAADCGNGNEIRFSNLEQGSYTITVVVVDAGGVPQDNVTYSWIIDDTAPTITFGTPTTPNNAVINTDAQFTFTVADNQYGSDLKTVTCAIDGGTPVACTNAFTGAKASLNNGSHTLVIRAEDNAGKITTATRTWTLDKTNPIVQLNPVAGTEVETSKDNVNISFTIDNATAPPETPVATACFLVLPNSTTNSVSCGSGLYAFDPDNRDGGVYIFRVVVTDQAGNVNTPAAEIRIVVDKNNPDTFFKAPAAPAVTKNRAITFNFDGTDNRTTDLDFHCTSNFNVLPPSDDIDWDDCNSGSHTVNLGQNDPDGTYVFAVRAEDKAGNVDPSPVTRTWILDTKPPVIAITSPVTQPVYYTNQSDLRFVYSVTDATTMTVTCKLNNSTEPCASSGQKLYTGAAETHNVFVLTAKDAVDTTSTKTITVSTDYTEPSTTLLGVEGNPTNNRFPNFTFMGSDDMTKGTGTLPANLTFQCSVDTSEWFACSSGSPLSRSVGDGTHTFQVRSLDRAGNVDLTPSSFTWRVDTSLPSTELIGTLPVSPTKVTTAAFQFTGADAPGGVGVTSFECQLNTSAWTICSSGHSYTGLASDRYTFRVRARDRASNVDDTPATHSWIVDAVAPSAPTISAPTANAVNKLEFTFSAQDNVNGSGIKRFECSLTTGPAPENWVACASKYTPTGPLTDGIYAFKVRAVDQVDNIGPSSTKTITLDQTAPIVRITPSVPLTATQSVTASFNVTYTSTLPRAGEQVTVSCTLDGTPWPSCASPVDFPTLTEDLHNFRVSAVDDLGNTGVATYTWRVDRTPPQAAFAPEHIPPFRNEEQPVLQFHGNDQGGSGVSTFECFLKGPSAGDTKRYYPCGTMGATSWWFKPDFLLTTGIYTFTITPIDMVGNKGTTKSSTWVNELQAPDTKPIVREPAEQLSSATYFTFTLGLTPTSVFSLSTFLECQLNDGTWAVCTSPHLLSNLPDGQYTLNVRARDQIGNFDQSHESTSWTVDRTGPVVALTGRPNAATKLSTATFTFSANDNGGSGLASAECRLNNQEWQACSTLSATYSDLAEGDYTFHVRATDRLGNVGAAITYSWTVDRTAPETAMTGDLPAVINAQSITLNFTGTDALTAEGLKFECSLDNGPFESCVNPRTFPGLTNGVHNLRVRAIDGAGNIDETPATHQWRVEVANPIRQIHLPLVKK